MRKQPSKPLVHKALAIGRKFIGLILVGELAVAAGSYYVYHQMNSCRGEQHQHTNSLIIVTVHIM